MNGYQKSFVSDWKKTLSDFAKELKASNTTNQLSHLQSEKVRLESQQKQLAPELKARDAIGKLGLTDADVKSFKSGDVLSMLEGLEHEASRARGHLAPVNHDLLKKTVDDILTASPSGIKSGWHSILDQEGRKHFLGLMGQFGIEREPDRKAVFSAFYNQLAPQAKAGLTSVQQRGAVMESLDFALRSYHVGQANKLRRDVEQDFIRPLRGHLNEKQISLVRNQFLRQDRGGDFLNALRSYDPVHFAKVRKEADDLAASLKNVKSEITKLSPSKPAGFADGGCVSGYYSRGTDTVPAMLTPGEYVVKAKQAKKNRHLLDAINRGHIDTKNPLLFANGGPVTPRSLADIQSEFNRLNPFEQGKRLADARMQVFCLSRIWKNAPFGLA